MVNPRPSSFFRLNRALSALCVLVYFLFSCTPPLAMERGLPESKPTVGWLEQIRIYPPGLLLEAKLDTGADVSSLHAIDMKEFTKNGHPWIRFTVTDRKGDQAIMEEPLLRTITITRHGGREEKRPVAILKLCLGHLTKSVEVSLVDRTGLKFPVLVGRNFMAGSFLLDPSQEFITTPSCDDHPGQ